VSGFGNTIGIQSVNRLSPNKYELTLTNNTFVNNEIYFIKITDKRGDVGGIKFIVGHANLYPDSTVSVDRTDNIGNTNQFRVTINTVINDLTANNFTLTRYPFDKYLESYFWYYLDPSFWYKKGNFTALGDGTGITKVSWLPEPVPIQASENFPSSMTGKDKAVAVKYYVVWPDNLPILKAGETLTFPGGEYRVDNPTYPGLPGVLGWASGQVIYDSLNPSMDTNELTITTNYLVRFVPFLEERTVPFVNQYPDMLKPAGGRVDIINGRYYFKDLPAGLKTRIFYDPLTNKLGIRGFINDKTIGDKTLTASPPPIYVVQPNVLTKREGDILK
ncbi:hypothetical protein MHK_001777, partial [Candidatus Magnetomorum sp. HK-1]